VKEVTNKVQPWVIVAMIRSLRDDAHGREWVRVVTIWEHKNKVIPGFTAKYNVNQLVYYELHQDIMEAARRERRLKNWCRQWKLNIIGIYSAYSTIVPVPAPVFK
jgi:hypothetical protein